jgi:hypothetical protein
VERLTNVTEMTDGRRMLLETLVGHFELLKTNHPRKAASATAKRAQRLIQSYLRATGQRRRAA